MWVAFRPSSVTVGLRGGSWIAICRGRALGGGLGPWLRLCVSTRSLQGWKIRPRSPKVSLIPKWAREELAVLPSIPLLSQGSPLSLLIP